MTFKSLLLGAAIWLGSVTISFYVGSKVRSTDSTTRRDTATIAAVDIAQQQADSINSSAGDHEPETSNAEIDAALASTDEALAAQSSILKELEDAFALPENNFERTRIIRDLLEELAESDPLEALKLAEQINSKRGTEEAKRDILEVWGQNDPIAALNWVESAMQNEPLRARGALLTAVYEGFAQNDPKAAFTSALSLPADTSGERRLQTNVLEEIIAEQISNGGLRDAQVAVGLLDEGATKNRLLSELVGEWAEFDPIGAAAYVEAMEDNAHPDVKTSLLGEWAENDPAAAAAWLSAQAPDEDVIRRASAEIIREWTRYDMTASAEWLNSLPDSPALDRAVMSYTYRAAQEDPANAMTWAESISNDWMRNRMMERVASSWRVDDPQAFDAFLQQSELSQAQRDRLQNAEDFHGGGRWR